MGGKEIDPAAVLAAGEHMTIAGCAVRARTVYADAIATNDARGVLGRAVVALVVLPLAMFAGLTQMALYYTVRAASVCLPAWIVSLLLLRLSYRWSVPLACLVTLASTTAAAG